MKEKIEVIAVVPSDITQRFRGIREQTGATFKPHSVTYSRNGREGYTDGRTDEFRAGMIERGQRVGTILSTTS